MSSDKKRSAEDANLSSPELPDPNVTFGYNLANEDKLRLKIKFAIRNCDVIQKAKKRGFFMQLPLQEAVKEKLAYLLHEFVEEKPDIKMQVRYRLVMTMANANAGARSLRRRAERTPKLPTSFLRSLQLLMSVSSQTARVRTAMMRRTKRRLLPPLLMRRLIATLIATLCKLRGVLLYW